MQLRGQSGDNRKTASCLRPLLLACRRYHSLSTCATASAALTLSRSRRRGSRPRETFLISPMPPTVATDDAVPAQVLGKLKCLICSSHASGFHFDAQSCSACAAFFRRTVVLKKGYQCSNKEFPNRCNISYMEPKLCRACRFRKCLESGMDRNSVQPQKTTEQKQRNYFTVSGLKRNKRFAVPEVRAALKHKQPLPYYCQRNNVLVSLVNEELRTAERRRIAFCNGDANRMFQPGQNPSVMATPTECSNLDRMPTLWKISNRSALKPIGNRSASTFSSCSSGFGPGQSSSTYALRTR
uniref:Nuclear receptor domain-containing protein n=1 Tax=Steinernema glaseri TaxID=37863 RepID=A0A1I7Z4A6_9BILA